MSWDIIAFILGFGSGIAGIYFALRALGFWEYLGGKNAKPWAISRDELYSRLTSLNSEDLPYEIKPDASGRCDLVLEWKLVDAKWYGFFSKNRFSKWYKVYMLLDDSRKSLRYLEEVGTISWRVGSRGLEPIINIGYGKTFFRGRILFTREYSRAYGVKEDLKPGEIYSYYFDPSEPIGRIRKVVEEAGWELVPVTAMKHVTRSR